MSRRDAHLEFYRLKAEPVRIAMLRELVGVNGFSFGTDDTKLHVLNNWIRMYVEA